MLLKVRAAAVTQQILFVGRLCEVLSGERASAFPALRGKLETFLGRAPCNGDWLHVKRPRKRAHFENDALCARRKMNRASRGEIIEKADREETIEKRKRAKRPISEESIEKATIRAFAVQTFIVASFSKQLRNLPSHLGKFFLIASPCKRRLQLSLSLTVGGQV